MVDLGSGEPQVIAESHCRLSKVVYMSGCGRGGAGWSGRWCRGDVHVHVHSIYIYMYRYGIGIAIANCGLGGIGFPGFVTGVLGPVRWVYSGAISAWMYLVSLCWAVGWWVVRSLWLY